MKTGWFKHVSALTLLGTPIPQLPKPAGVPFPNPIYSLWLIQNNPAAALNASRHTAEENQARFDGMVKALDDCGSLTVLACDRYWNNEAYLAFGVDAFPSFEALEKLHWADYYPVFSVLGVPEGWKG
jgi:hypothetical protein